MDKKELQEKAREETYKDYKEDIDKINEYALASAFLGFFGFEWFRVRTKNVDEFGLVDSTFMSRIGGYYRSLGFDCDVSMCDGGKSLLIKLDWGN